MGAGLIGKASGFSGNDAEMGGWGNSTQDRAGNLSPQGYHWPFWSAAG